VKLHFVGISSRLPPWLEQLTGDYKKKLDYWISSECVMLSSPSHDRDAQDKKLKAESEMLLKYFRPDDFVLLCDEKGQALDSQSFAKRLEKILGGGKKRIVVVIGGAYGVSPEVKKRADLQLCLSEFTMTHHLALAVACEQVYRAMTILKGTSYHNA
jgi:23S rRNA (pseudouridine1915-N3)-methyltransferase